MKKKGGNGKRTGTERIRMRSDLTQEKYKNIMMGELKIYDWNFAFEVNCKIENRICTYKRHQNKNT